MFALAYHKKRHVMAITGRSVLAVVFAITALANIITVMKEFPWDSMMVTEPLIDLGGPAWEQDGLITGVLLLLVARALIRGKRQAWWLSVGLLTFSLTSAFVSKSDSSTILLALGQLILLLILAPFFPTRSDTRASVQGYTALMFGIGCIAAHIAVSQLWHMAGGQGAFVLRNGILFLLHLLAFLILGYGVVKVLHPVRSTRPRIDQEYARVYEAVRRYGSLATTHFALGRDKSYFWSETGRAVIAYRVVQGVALVLGDPIGPPEEQASVLLAFLAFCRRQDWPIALYQASAQMQHICQEGRLHAYKIGEEALIDIASFTLQGKRGAPVRHAVARARRAGLSACCWQGESLPHEVFVSMQRISAAWLDARKIQAQMGFSMGRFPADWSPELLTVVAFNAQGEVEAFLTWTPLYAGNGWALDAIRRGNETTPGTMELLIAHAIEWAQARGYTQMSLGLAPLAGLGGDALATTCNSTEWEKQVLPSPFLERSAAFLHRRGIVLGTYRSLYTFKAKFHPTWEARYLIIGEGQALPRILLAVARAHGSGWRSLLREACRTVFPINKTMKSVARLLHPGWPTMVWHKEQRKDEIENQPQTARSSTEVDGKR